MVYPERSILGHALSSDEEYNYAFLSLNPTLESPNTNNVWWSVLNKKCLTEKHVFSDKLRLLLLAETGQPHLCESGEIHVREW